MRTRLRSGWRTRTTLCAATAAVTVMLSAPPTASAGVQPNAYGVISSMNGESLSRAPQVEWNAQLAAIRQQGVQEVRSDAEWSDIEPQVPGPAGPSWQWSKYDAWVTALASAGLTWEPILDYNTSWARADLNPQAFSTFAQAVAARYGANGTFWTLHPLVPYLPAQIFEIWNEENVMGLYYMNPASYARLYLNARGAIRGVDPSASVDVGGLANDANPAGYVGLMMAANPSLRGSIDAVGLHPYAASGADSVASVASFHHALSGWGEGAVPLDLTEFGWPYELDLEPWRATQMSTLGAALSRSNCGIRLAAPYDWVNPGDPSGDYGLVDVSGLSTALRPAGGAWFGGFAQGSSLAVYNVC